MSESKIKPSTVSCDESLSHLTNCSSINHNLETTMSQDTLTVALDKESKSNCHRIISLEIVANLILIGIAILFQFSPNAELNNSRVNSQGVEINTQLIDN
ncbi:MAG: hypothetical protein QNJ60_07725 [Xenococcaceae cyanobacterium MO_188.B19]|nr:hypothetical protein [Xenococcaceae cyanobacterium MO_188.B19]